MKAPKKSLPKPKLPDAGYEVEKHLRQFCDVTSLELSQLLGAAIGELDYGLSSANLFERGEAISVSLRALEKALHLSHNLRYFAVQTRLDLQPRDLSQIVLDVVDRIESDFKNRRIQLGIFVEDNLFARVDAS